MIGGYYQANDYFHEIPAPIPTVFAERISEKINETNPESVMIMLNDYNLATSIDHAEKLNQPLFLFTHVDGKLKLKSANNARGFQLENFPLLYQAIQELIFRKQYHLNLVDFDAHLENVKNDWRNVKLNEIIEKFEIQ
ncbi:COX4 neighbor protein-like protein [Euroglyphus maynei]|uniref:COX4 neighbor protein-like protein n=1 Tax=Euroglyphus maynei TaxID=6958 RepID=A0A1Y3BGB7_EURMA|nr:COX4 neighbor protein-like protein [Euroglyphus maynei]